jgi:hypothetical protein
VQGPPQRRPGVLLIQVRPEQREQLVAAQELSRCAKREVDEQGEPLRLTQYA